jgi:hypothetical protein
MGGGSFQVGLDEDEDIQVAFTFVHTVAQTSTMHNDNTALYAGCRRVCATAQRSPVEHTGGEGVSSLDRVRPYICRYAVVCRSRRLTNTVCVQ